MNAGRSRGAQLATENDVAGAFTGDGGFRFHYFDRASREEDTTVSPASLPQNSGIPRRYSRYSDQPTNWAARIFGLASTTTIIGLVLAAALFTWKIVYPSIEMKAQPLTVVELQPLAAPPEPVRDVAPGPDQVVKQEAELEPAPEPIPTPIIQLAVPNISTREARKPVEIIDPGPAVPETTAPRSVAAPTANRLSNDARLNWEEKILAHLERFRRYPARARAARQQGTVYVRLRLSRAGMVLSSVIVKKSGSFDLDQAAIETLRRAQPLPAIPSNMPEEVELSVPVEYYLER